MSTKSIIVEVYNYLSQDPQILQLLDLVDSTEQEKQEYIIKSRQLPNIADRKARLTIWENESYEESGRVQHRELVVDVLVPLHDQVRTGVAFDLIDRIYTILIGKPIGTGLKRGRRYPDMRTAFGWHKGSVRFPYNYIIK